MSWGVNRGWLKGKCKSIEKEENEKQMRNIKSTMKFIGISILIGITISSCKKDEPLPPSNTGLPVAIGDGVFVTNEGNYLSGNSQLSFYRFNDGTATEDLFYPTNTRPLGDVCQSMSLINGMEYIVVNNSGKIEVCYPSNLRSAATIAGFTSPRFILAVSPTKAYVSDLFANAISIVNLSNNTRTGSFPFPGESEAMVMIGTDVFISSTDHDKVYVINSLTDQITDSITVAKGGNSMQLDNNGKLWVLCYGDYFTSAPGGLFRINTISHSVELSLPFTTTESPTKLCANSTLDTLYYLNYSVYRMTSSSTSLPTVPFLSATTQSFYGIGIRPITGEVFVTDAVNYTSRGHLYRYSAAGVLLDDDLIGICPGGVYFY